MKPNQHCAFTLIEILVFISIISVLAVILLSVVSRTRASSHTSTCATNLHQIAQALNLYTADNDGYFPPVVTLKPSINLVGDSPKFASTWWMNLKMTPAPVCPDVDLSWFSNIPGVRRQINGYASNYNLTNNSGSNIRPNLSGRAEFVLSHPSLTVTAFDARPLIRGLREPDMLLTMKDMRRAARPTDFDSDIIQLSPGATRHQGGANYLFGDGHVKWMKPEQLSTTPKNDGVHPGFGL